MKHEVGDRVQVKSLDWYNTSKNKYGVVELIGSNGCGFNFLEEMSAFCGEVMTISNIGSSDCGYYDMKEDNGAYFWTDEMIEGLVEEETKPMTYEDTVEIIETMQGIGDSWECPQGYQFKDENGNVINATKIVLEKKKKEYPKTFKECVHVLEGENRMSLEQMNTFRKLIDARNAYWKIAGEEMGLRKPWKPDWNTSKPKYVIACTCNGIEKQWEATYCKVFAFPTGEMRDAFKENFDPDIKICKEFL